MCPHTGTDLNRGTVDLENKSYSFFKNIYRVSKISINILKQAHARDTIVCICLPSNFVVAAETRKLVSFLVPKNGRRGLTNKDMNTNSLQITE